MTVRLTIKNVFVVIILMEKFMIKILVFVVHLHGKVYVKMDKLMKDVGVKMVQNQ